MYLFSTNQSLHALFKAVADAVYNDLFFGDALSLGHEKRIRAVVQNSNIEFAERMTGFGYTYASGESSTRAKASRDTSSKNITKDQYIDLVQILMKRTRGRELPGIFNPIIIVDLFRQQSNPWEKIARDHIGTVRKAVKTCIIFALEHVA